MTILLFCIEDGKVVISPEKRGITMKEKKKTKKVVTFQRIMRIAAVAGIILFLAGVIFAAHMSDKLSDKNDRNTAPADALPVGAPLYSGDLDPKKQSIAVFPDTEKIEDVEDATLTELSKSDLEIKDTYGNEDTIPDHMKRYLPTTLPEGYDLAHASLYETTMLSGKKYYMIRATYWNYANSSGDIRPELMVTDEIRIIVWNYNPGIERPIYTLDSITEDANEELKNYGIFLSVDDVFMSISLVDSWDDCETILHSIDPS